MAVPLSTPLEIRLVAVLKRIAQYQSPESLRRFSERDYGVGYEEALEMAYENVVHEAKVAVKGVRIKLAKGILMALWQLSHRADERSRLIADRHYNRQKPGTPQFVPPGRCAVFYAKTETGQAFWVTSFPFAEYVKHAWAGAWVCSAFRNESAGKASEMIVEALACTRHRLGEPPPLGMITFINMKFVQPYKTGGGKMIFGQTFRQAGFKEVGITKGGLLAFQILPERMPPAQAPIDRGVL